MKGERNILTRESITEKLVYEAKRSMVGCVLVLILGTVVLGMLNFILALGLPNSSKAPGIVAGISLVGFIAVCAFFFIRAILRMNKAKRGEFSIGRDILEYVEDNQLNIWRALFNGRPFDRSNYEHIFVFKSGKRFIANSDEYRNTSLDATAQFSMSGDSFVLVSYIDAPEKIVLLYSEKLYNYKK